MPRKKKEDVTISYKGFNSDWTCRDFQYEVGKEYVAKGKIVPCNNGFHACKMPLDVLNYYMPIDDKGRLNKFAIVEQAGTIKEEDDKKASSKIKIKTALSFSELFKLEFELIKDLAQSTTGDEAHSSTTGNYAHSSTTGDEAHSSTTGDEAHSSTTGNYAHSSTTGNYAHSSTTGDEAHSSTTGDEAHSSTTGNYAHSSTTGWKAHSSTTGWKAHSSTTGWKAHSSTTGNYAHSSTTGDEAHSSTTGNYAHSSTTGDEAIASALGIQAKAKATNGWIVIVDWRQDENYKWHIHNIYSAKVGDKIQKIKIKADTYYWFENGELKEEN